MILAILPHGTVYSQQVLYSRRASDGQIVFATKRVSSPENGKTLFKIMTLSDQEIESATVGKAQLGVAQELSTRLLIDDRRRRIYSFEVDNVSEIGNHHVSRLIIRKRSVQGDILETYVLHDDDLVVVYRFAFLTPGGIQFARSISAETSDWQLFKKGAWRATRWDALPYKFRVCVGRDRTKNQAALASGNGYHQGEVTIAAPERVFSSGKSIIEYGSVGFRSWGKSISANLRATLQYTPDFLTLTNRGSRRRLKVHGRVAEVILANDGSFIVLSYQPIVERLQAPFWPDSRLLPKAAVGYSRNGTEQFRLEDVNSAYLLEAGQQ